VKTSNNFMKLFGRSAGTTADGVTLSRLLSASGSSSLTTSVPPSKVLTPGAAAGVRSLPLSETTTAKIINFGSPSSRRTTSSQTTSEWANLLKQTASGGLSSALGGGVLSAIGGLGGLVSSFAGLFSTRKKTEAPLTLFSLPDSQSETVFATSTQTPTTPETARSAGIYASSSSSSHVVYGQSPATQTAQIAEAVKQALLNSSSLNDVIAEI
jgi:hypothetical protein